MARRKQIIELDSENGWPKLQASIDQLIMVCENDFPPKTDMSQAMANYSIVYDLAVQRPPHNYCEEMYTRYKNVYVKYLQDTVLPALRERGGAFMLAEIGKRWTNHRDIMVKWMKKFFLYLDNYYTKNNHVPSLYDTGMLAFKDTMFPLVKDDVTTAILELVAAERAGDSIDRSLLKSVVDLFVQMGLGSMDVYRDGFEVQFLETTASYYARVALDKAPSSTLPEYLQMCSHQLGLEQTRVGNYLHGETEEKLIKAVKHELLEVPQVELMTKRDSGLVVVFGASLPFAETNREMVRLLYSLYADLPTLITDERLLGVKHGKAAITDMLFEHIKKLGADEVTAQIAKSEDQTQKSEGGKEFIERLVAIHKHFVTLFEEDCAGDKDFHAVLKQAYQKHIINNAALGDPHFIPRLLSEFCDFYLNKATCKAVTMEDQQKNLESAVQMYSYLDDKDYFNQHYKRSLANRLLHDTTVGTDQEEQFLTLVKQKCGAMWTKHQEGMIADIKKSDGLHQSQFAAYRKEPANGCESFAGVDVSVRLLNERMWPAIKEDKLVAPVALQTVISAFNKYFEASQAKSATDGPTIDLNWMLTQGNATIKPVYGGGKGFGHKAFKNFKIQLANPYQLAILLLFNERDHWTAPELEAQLMIDTATLKKYVDSLWRPQIKVLKARSVDKSVKDPPFADLTFEVNKNLPKESTKKGKALPKLRYDMGKEDIGAVASSVDQAVQEERKFAIDAAIVRTMKAGKTCKISTLIPEVCKQLSFLFVAHPPFVRKRMEELVDKAFMERDDQDPTLLRYIA